MTLSRRRFMTISAGLALTHGMAFAAPSHSARWRGIALGAKADLRLYGLPKDEAELCLSRVRDEITRLERIFSLYRSDSELTRLNTDGYLANPSSDMLALLSIVATVHEGTGGRFDPTVQPLWTCYAESAGQPAARALKRALAVTGWQKVAVAPSQITLPKGGALTLNGIAQGYITDKIVAQLRAFGLTNALADVGEIAALGHPPSASAWTVGLAETGDRTANDYVDLRDQSVATSAPLATSFDEGTVGHILNPKSGQPVESDWSYVSVIHKSAALADGLSTAALMLNPEEMRSCAKRFARSRIIARRQDQITHVFRS